MKLDTSPMKIGTLARAAEVGVETIRYYQRRRLLGEPPRPLGGQRLYPAEDVDRLRFIKRAQGLGFSLDEIATLLTLEKGTAHVRAHTLASRRLAEIEAKLADLTTMRDALADLVSRCEHTHGKVACPIIATLASSPAIAPPARKFANGLRGSSTSGSARVRSARRS